MKLSTRARYALRMMVDIAKQTHSGQESISLAQVAKHTNISRRYLEQLAMALKNSSLIRAKTGKGGGYSLVKPPSEINAGEIIEAAIGPINIVDCVLEPDTCDKVSECGCHSIYREINDRIVDTLDNLTLERIAKLDEEKSRSDSHPPEERLRQGA